MRGSFVFFLYKKNSRVTVMPLKDKKKYTCMEAVAELGLFVRGG
jgi:hypothetical protein